jgi:hypothetical protein
MRRDPGAWSRQPVVWLGALILAASIAGCVVMIVLALRFADAPVDADGSRVMNVPLRHATETAAPRPEN